ncbi:enoyl-CoA hydratase/isomerase family protein [Baekduia soli]|uniref:Enoyl-CoA hydratase/isomerase family protein n=1 Tax=Baekduia soli TaxID=496014 RepID=A0A5B8U460_9ACTN|nr:enoyl-CoA hydratase/isomerase family protein [Baekduia soli]QEC47810.1 enoyl-CoA hydratase/isomerase family protein [Baekduia soli]
MTTLTRERLDDGIEVLRLDRPAARNAMDTALLTDLLAALEDLGADPDLRVLVISTTSERALSAGADVAEVLDHAAGVARMELFTRMYAALESFPAPTIAVAVGNCVGAGAELTLCCDLRVAGDNLKLMFPGARLGVPVGPARLVPLVGLSKARELIFTGRVVGAEEVRELGLLAGLAPAAEAEARAIDLAREVAVHPPEGLRRLKAMVRELEATEGRVARENAALLEFQRSGTGLPYGGVGRGGAGGAPDRG